MSQLVGIGWSGPVIRVFDDVLGERHRQLVKWGPQRHDTGTGLPGDRGLSDWYRRDCDAAAAVGDLTWRHILLEEVYEALAETEREPLRRELVQAAAVIFAIIEDLDNRAGDRATVVDPEPALLVAA
jgi:hypothetical protein